MRSLATILISLSLPLHAFAAHAVNPGRRHADVALRPRQQFSGERMTYYDITTGTTACGGNYVASDYVVAITHLQYNGGSLCGKSITITYQGKSAGATIVDECMGCPYGGLDLTEDLFSYLAGGLGAGVITGDWDMGGAPAPAPAPTTTYHPPPSPTTHYDPPPQTTSTSTWSPPPPSSSSSSSSSTTSTTSKTSSLDLHATPTTSHQPPSSTSSPTSSNAGYNNGPASSAAEPTGSVDSNGQSESIESLYVAIINMGTIVLASNPNS